MDWVSQDELRSIFSAVEERDLRRLRDENAKIKESLRRQYLEHSHLVDKNSNSW